MILGTSVLHPTSPIFQLQLATVFVNAFEKRAKLLSVVTQINPIYFQVYF
jgi:hypothetical protein